MGKPWFCRRCWKMVGAHETQNYGRIHRECGGQTVELFDDRGEDEPEDDDAGRFYLSARIRNRKGITDESN